MEIFRAISSSSQSVTVFPSATFPEPGGHPGGVEQRRHQLRFSGVAVADNADVSDELRVIGSHKRPLYSEDGALAPARRAAWHGAGP